MKKILVLLTLVGSIAMAQGNVYEFRAGWDLYNRAKDSNKEYEIRKDVLQTGPEVSFEYRRELTNNFDLGAGIAYKYNNLTDKKVEVDENKVDVSMKGLHSVPIYATARYNFATPSEDIVPYVKANLGYSINSGKLESKYAQNTTEYPDSAGRIDESYKFKNGLYYGLGTGLKYKNFFVDLSYNVIRSKVENTYMSSVYHTNVNGVRGTTYEYDKWNTKVNSKFVTLSFGYSFGF